MNFVGHLYLSGDNCSIAIGNFIGDYVKGKKYESYPEGIKRGIIIHRDIDTFTDGHPSYIAAKSLFRAGYGKYAGVAVDMAFDHILTKYWSDWHDEPLKEFTRKFYRKLMGRYLILPLHVKQIVPFVIKSDRLATYATLEGIKKALSIMSNYSTLPPMEDIAIEVIETHEELLKKMFYVLMCDLSLFINEKYGLETSTKASIQIAKNQTLKE
jgi:acyl carrier protein phosphodiesterase